MSRTRDAAARRAEAREERRARQAPNADDAAPSTDDHDTVATALRGAAAAAALGAALGAARALASREDDQGEDVQPPAQGAAPAGEEAEGLEDEQPVARDEPAERQSGEDSSETETARGASPGTVRSITGKAREQFTELHGAEPESLTALERLGSRGWRVTFEVVEVERVPNSTDVLATYVLELDDDAQLTSYERVRRYYRAQADLGDER